MNSKHKIVALINKDNKLENNHLFKSIRHFYGLWNNLDYIRENTYQNECFSYDLYIYENDIHGYDVGDLVHTSNVALETIKSIDKDYGTAKGYEWLINVEGNGNGYKPCEMHGKIIATTNMELCLKHNISEITNSMIIDFVTMQGNVDVSYIMDGSLCLVPNDYINSGKSIQLVDATSRHEVSRDEHEVMNKANMTLAWNTETEGYDIVLKNRYGKNGTIYDWSDIENIMKHAFQAGIDFENDCWNNDGVSDNDDDTIDLKKYLKKHRPTH